MAYKVIGLKDAAGAPRLRDGQPGRHRAQALEDDLRKLAADLSEADRRKDEFLATLAHELRNPLAPLQQHAARSCGARATTPTRASGRARRWSGSSAQLVRLVDDLLDLSRITHNRLELRKGPVELAARHRAGVEAARPLAESMRHELRVILPPEPIYLHADPARLAQVFGNLLNNSCKYTTPGGTIWLTAERAGRRGGGDACRDNGDRHPARQARHRLRDVHAGRRLARSGRRAASASA